MWGQGLTWEAVGEPAGGGEPLEAAPLQPGAGGHVRAGPSKQEPRGSAGSGGEDPRRRSGCPHGQPRPLSPGQEVTVAWMEARDSEPRPGAFHRPALLWTRWAWRIWRGGWAWLFLALPTPLHHPPLPLMLPGPVCHLAPRGGSPSRGLGRPVHPTSRRPLLSTFPDLPHSVCLEAARTGPGASRAPGEEQPL